MKEYARMFLETLFVITKEIREETIDALNNSRWVKSIMTYPYYGTVSAFKRLFIIFVDRIYCDTQKEVCSKRCI